MTGVLLRARSYAALGIRNLGRVGLYRLGLRAGVHPVLRARPLAPGTGPFFVAGPDHSNIDAVSAHRNHVWDDRLRLYGYRLLEPASNRPVPDFLANPVTGRRWRTADQPWNRIADFDPHDGDVKMVWELSRLEWAPAFAQAVRAGRPAALNCLNAWLGGWADQNPGYIGPNWKCGQEGSIRILHLAAAALILEPVAIATPRLMALVETHLRRIAPTLSYALGQDNNHGTSEAAALFVGGSWLAAQGIAVGHSFARTGRRWLEERAVRLFLSDGSFSQHSLNYHRLALDTFVFADVWRRHLGLAPFSDRLTARLWAAGDWLHAFTDPVTGDAPNLGHNDGARILVLTDAAFRDYRPSVARAKALFADERAYDDPAIDADLAWLGIPPGSRWAAAPVSRLFDKGGYAVLRRGRAMALLRYPHFQFRPAQDDLMHVDLWLDGRAVLPDGGSYSYNAGAEWLDYFMGPASHNSVTFDGDGHMPRLGRFLFGAWPDGEVEGGLVEDGDTTRIAVAYRDWHGRRHRRIVALCENGMEVVDEADGPGRFARLRWRLAADRDWTRTATGVIAAGIELTVDAGPGAGSGTLVPAHEARHYDENTELLAWDIEAALPCRLTTNVTW